MAEVEFNYLGPPQIHRRLDWLIPGWLENVDAYSQSADANLNSICWTILVNVAIAILFVLSFSLYRKYGKHGRTLYNPKQVLMPEKTPDLLPFDTLFGWVGELWSIDDKTIVESGGTDVLFNIRFYRLGFIILAFSSIYCWLVILPVNGFGGNDASDSFSFDR